MCAVSASVDVIPKRMQAWSSDYLCHQFSVPPKVGRYVSLTSRFKKGLSWHTMIETPYPQSPRGFDQRASAVTKIVFFSIGVAGSITLVLQVVERKRWSQRHVGKA